MTNKPSIELAPARIIALELVTLLQAACERIEIAGSIRREKASVSDLEIVAQPKDDKLHLADELLAQGIFQKRHAWGDRAKFGIYKGMPFDLFVSLEDRQFACTYWLRTGSKDANRLMVTQWAKGGILPDDLTFCAEQFWKLPAPLFQLDSDEVERCKGRGDMTPLGGIVIPTSTEAQLFALVDLPFIPPRYRDEKTYRVLAGRRLVSFHDVAHLWDERAARWLIPELFYIGRTMPHVNLPGSAWANPIRLTQDTPENRAGGIAQYRAHITERLVEGRVSLDELRGKTLVCWCADYDEPKPCHGDVLLELLEVGKPAPAKPQQIQMFSGAMMLDYEHRAAAIAEHPAEDRRRGRQAEPFEWVSPWLTDDGRVWVHMGYGEYELRQQTDSRAMAYFGKLHSLDYKGVRAHRHRLEMFLWNQTHTAVEPVAKPAAPVKALSLWNPWAVLVMRGLKRYETRHWQTPYRGKLVVHAAKRWTKDEQNWLAHFIEELKLDVSPHSPYWSMMHEKRFFGVALGTVDLVDIVPTENCRRLSRTERLLGNYEYGRFAWKLENPEPFDEPIPCKGMQSLWNWEEPVR